LSIGEKDRRDGGAGARVEAGAALRCRVGCRLGYELTEANTFVFNIAPVENRCQQLQRESLRCEPELEREEHRSSLGNRYWRLHVPAGAFELVYEAEVLLDAFWCQTAGLSELSMTAVPMDVLPYIHPSRYCPSDRLLQMAHREFGAVESGFVRVQAISDWVGKHLEYAPGSSDQHTSACDSLLSRRGVCRDFAHLGIALCRALNIPARFVAAYADGLTPVDFHACFEAYLGDRWFLFDPTGQAQMATLVRMGTGRDAADVAFATIFGWAQMRHMEVFIDVDGIVPTRQNEAVSTWVG